MHSIWILTQPIHSVCGSLWKCLIETPVLCPSSGPGKEAQVDGLCRDEQGSSFGLYSRGTVLSLDLVLLHQLQDDTQTHHCAAQTINLLDI